MAKASGFEANIYSIDQNEEYQLIALDLERARLLANRIKLEREVDYHISKYLELQQQQDDGVAGVAVRKSRLKTKEFKLVDQMLENSNKDLKIVHLKRKLIENRARMDRQDVEMAQMQEKVDELEAIIDRQSEVTSTEVVVLYRDRETEGQLGMTGGRNDIISAISCFQVPDPIPVEGNELPVSPDGDHKNF